MKYYKCFENSKHLLVDALIRENVKRDVKDLELQTCKEDQCGVKEYTLKLTNILVDSSTAACKTIIKPYKLKKKKYEQAWSDEVIYETKREINALGFKIKHRPDQNFLKQKYFLLCKQLKKAVKKKSDYKQKIYDLLTNKIDKDQKEYWKILKSLKLKDDEEEIPEIYQDEENKLNISKTREILPQYILSSKKKIETILSNMGKKWNIKTKLINLLPFQKLNK
ncbi:unnamed protein product [Mytilus coruscus]|uniref:Uncharacterized protein n=1 Tax=Mytilus coruscus TaxID=42192 RepID=A0A6J8AQC9_MYTCO|nr:unnamed protein product [Mytilus coruscus]